MDREFQTFDILPVFKEHLSKLDSTGVDFVNSVIKLDLEKCRISADQHFQLQNTDEAIKCMELLALIAGWPLFGENSDLTKQIAELYRKDEVTLAQIRHSEFVGDVMYMGLYRTLKNEDGSPIDEFDEGKAEFFRWMACEMYESIAEKSLNSRLGLESFFVLYSESLDYYPYDVWPNWYRKTTE